MRSNLLHSVGSRKSPVSQKARNRSTKPVSMLLELLDSRQMMSATGVTADLVSTVGSPVLEVHGTMSADVIGVTQSGASLTVTDGGVLVGTYTGVGEVDVFAGKGADTISVDPSVTVNTVLRGGRGADSITGGSGMNTIYGGRGSNSLNAGPGTSIVYAGDGNNDTLVATAGARDTLVGGAGTDTFWAASDTAIQNFHAGDTQQNISGFPFIQIDPSTLDIHLTDIPSPVPTLNFLPDSPAMPTFSYVLIQDSQSGEVSGGTIVSNNTSVFSNDIISWA